LAKIKAKINTKIKFEFNAKIWIYSGKGAWHFVALPLDMSKEIRDNLKDEEEGWGRLKAVAEIGNTKWDTAIWFDTKRKTYLLPIKAEIRKKEKLETDMEVQVRVWI
jgi:hypothetical protein